MKKAKNPKKNKHINLKADIIMYVLMLIIIGLTVMGFLRYCESVRNDGKSFITTTTTSSTTSTTTTTTTLETRPKTTTSRVSTSMKSRTTTKKEGVDLVMPDRDITNNVEEPEE